MHQVFLGIGGNIGNKSQNFRKVVTDIEKQVGVVLLQSSIYETPPWGFYSEENFWNQVLMVSTKFNAPNLLSALQNIENKTGTKRAGSAYADREMDIDILYFDHVILETDKLIIPHPKIQLRKFVLVPLAEIAPDFKHPLLQLTSTEMLENCKDSSQIKKII